MQGVLSECEVLKYIYVYILVERSDWVATTLHVTYMFHYLLTPGTVT